MPYILNQTVNNLAIRELEYASGQEIRFTTFTSCIGVIARQGGQVTGIHLAIYSNVAPHDIFNDADVQEITQILNNNYTQIVVIGQVDVWRGSIPGPYQTLINSLNNPRVISLNDGNYGGRVENGIFQTYQNGNYYPV